MKNIIYEGIQFNTEWAATKTEAEFIEHEKHHFEGDPNGEEKLKEAYARITKKVGKTEPEILVDAVKQPVQTKVPAKENLATEKTSAATEKEK